MEKETKFTSTKEISYQIESLNWQITNVNSPRKRTINDLSKVINMHVCRSKSIKLTIYLNLLRQVSNKKH